MRVAIVGSRNYPDLDAVRAYVRGLPADTVIVTGGAIGVDITAEAEARACGLPVPEIHLPDYALHGRPAPLFRNYEIARSCDRLVAFHDGKSTGTLHAIACARKFGKPVEIIAPAPPTSEDD